MGQAAKNRRLRNAITRDVSTSKWTATPSAVHPASTPAIAAGPGKHRTNCAGKG